MAHMAERAKNDSIIHDFFESLHNGTLEIEKKKTTGGLRQDYDVMISIPAKATGNVVHITIRNGHEKRITSTGHINVAIKNDRMWFWESSDCTGYKISKHKANNYSVAKITVSDKKRFLEYCDFAGKYFVEWAEEGGDKIYFIRKENKR